MAGQLTGPTGTLKGGMPLEAWITKYVTASRFEGEALVKDGLAQKDACLVLANLRAQKGLMDTVFGEPLEMMPLAQGIRQTLDVPGRAAIPLGVVPDMNLESIEMTVLKQCARDYLSLGLNQASMSLNNVVNMYYNVLQNLVYAMGRETTPTTDLVLAFFCLLRAFFQLHRLPDVDKITRDLCILAQAQDSIHKALAHALTQTMTPLVVLRLAETVLWRNMKRGTQLSMLCPGPVAIFLFLPLVEQYLADPSMQVAHVVERYLASIAKYQEEIKKATTGVIDADEIEARILHTVLRRQPGLNHFTLDHARALFQGAETRTTPDWTALGVFRSKSIAFVYDHIVNADVEAGTGDTIRIVSKNASTWSSLVLQTPGVYTIHIRTMGNATAAQGNTHGKNMSANVRVTLGTQAFPKDQPGFGVSGMRYDPGTQTYTDTGRPIDILKPLILNITDTNVSLHEGLWSASRDRKLGVVLAFKYASLAVTYEPNRAPGLDDLRRQMQERLRLNMRI